MALLMVKARQSEPGMFGRMVSVSLLVHGLVLAGVAVLAVPRALVPPLEQVISVDMVPAAQLVRPQAPLPLAPVPAAILAGLAAASPALEPPAAIAASGGQRVQATDFYAASILADPANAGLRRSFGSLAGSEQAIQLCNMEALEQIALGETGPAPDTMVGYAFDEITVDGLVVTANGGAFRRQGQWFRVQFSCTVASDMAAVTAFDYQAGARVPESEWEEHFLNDTDDGLEP